MTTDQHPGQLPTEIHADEPPTKMKSSLSGTSDRILDVMQRGDKGVAIVEFECTGTGFKTLSKATAYVQDFKVLDLFPLPHAEGRERLKRARSEHRLGVAEASGEHPFDGFGDVGWTDGSGTVLTRAELAQLRAEGGEAFPPAPAAPAVVECSDGSKFVWPDEYPKGQFRPRVGDLSTQHTEPDVTVARLLDFDTGEDIVETAAADVEAAGFFGARAGTEGGGGDGLTGEAVGEGLDTASPAADDFEDPDPILPELSDFAALEGSQKEIREHIAASADVDHLRRLAVAERQRDVRVGEGRKVILAAVQARIIDLEKAGDS